MHQERLFVLAVESLNLTASFVAGEGWHLQVGSRRQGDPWGDASWTHYDHLTTAELADVVAAEIATRLSLL